MATVIVIRSRRRSDHDVLVVCPVGPGETGELVWERWRADYLADDDRPADLAELELEWEQIAMYTPPKGG